MAKKSNVNFFLVIICIFMFGLVILTYYKVYKLSTENLINYHKIKNNFEEIGLKDTLKDRGYDEVSITDDGILIKRGNATFYFTTRWEKIEFEDKHSISNQYYIKDLTVNANGRFCKDSHYIKFVSEDKNKSEFNTLNNFFDFNPYILSMENCNILAVPALDDAFPESYGLFTREVMSVLELNSYCNEAKFLQKYLARKSREI